MGQRSISGAAHQDTVDSDKLGLIDARRRAWDYLPVDMIYLVDNPWLKELLKVEQVKQRLLGHLGASPALLFVRAHLNRVVKRDDLDVILVAGPGHGAPGVLGPACLEGAYSKVYPDQGEDAAGMRKCFKRCSFPGHIGSHVTPETPGSIHEGGELGYWSKVPDRDSRKSSRLENPMMAHISRISFTATDRVFEGSDVMADTRPSGFGIGQSEGVATSTAKERILSR